MKHVDLEKYLANQRNSVLAGKRAEKIVLRSLAHTVFAPYNQREKYDSNSQERSLDEARKNFW